MLKLDKRDRPESAGCWGSSRVLSSSGDTGVTLESCDEASSESVDLNHQCSRKIAFVKDIKPDPLGNAASAADFDSLTFGARMMLSTGASKLSEVISTMDLQPLCAVAVVIL